MDSSSVSWGKKEEGKGGREGGRRERREGRRKKGKEGGKAEERKGKMGIDTPLLISKRLLYSAIPLCQAASHIKTICKGEEVVKQVVDKNSQVLLWLYQEEKWQTEA